jgi:enoyl-CoA hydratase
VQYRSTSFRVPSSRPETHLSGGLAYERKAFCLLAATDDRNEGISAFLEKRTPTYHGC